MIAKSTLQMEVAFNKYYRYIYLKKVATECFHIRDTTTNNERHPKVPVLRTTG